MAAGRERSRNLQTLYVSSLDHWPTGVDIGVSQFALFLGCHATEISDDALATFAQRALASGAVDVVIWGPGCERIHDTFEEQHVAMTRDDADCPHVMTTWHANESLDEALRFFADAALASRDDLRTGLAVAVGREDWHDQICRRLADLPGLRTAVLDHPSEQPRQASEPETQ